MSIQETKLKAIAGAIREKDGTTEPIAANDFPERIRAISSVPDGLRTITLTADPPEGGTVSGGGVAQDGMTVTVNAIPADGYLLDSWTEDDVYLTEGDQTSYTFPINGNKSLIAVFKEKPIYRLPEGYTELEYISGGINSHINTKMYPNFNQTRIIMDVKLGTYTGTTEFIFASDYQPNKRFSFYRERSGYISIYLGSSSSITRNIDLTKQKTHVDLDLNTGILKIEENNTVVTTNGVSGTGTNPIYIGGSANGRAPVMDIYTFDVYDGDSLLLQLVPCINPSNIVGMFDVIKEVFYAPSAGTYSPGPEV